MQGFLASASYVRVLACTSVIPVVFYLSTGLAGCSVSPEISCGARKLAGHPGLPKEEEEEEGWCEALSLIRL